MKNKIANIFLGSLAVLTVVTISFAIIGIGLEIKNEFRKYQERKVCRKLGGYYDYFEKCIAADGGTIILPEVK